VQELKVGRYGLGMQIEDEKHEYAQKDSMQMGFTSKWIISNMPGDG